MRRQCHQRGPVIASIKPARGIRVQVEEIAAQRRKIEEDASHPRLIRTVRGVGYLYKSSD